MNMLMAALILLACGFVVYLGSSAAIGGVVALAKGAGLTMGEIQAAGWTGVGLLVLLVAYGAFSFLRGDLDASAHEADDAGVEDDRAAGTGTATAT